MGAVGPAPFRADSGRGHDNGQPLVSGTCGLPRCLPHFVGEGDGIDLASGIDLDDRPSAGQGLEGLTTRHSLCGVSGVRGRTRQIGVSLRTSPPASADHIYRRPPPRLQAGWTPRHDPDRAATLPRGQHRPSPRRPQPAGLPRPPGRRLRGRRCTVTSTWPDIGGRRRREAIGCVRGWRVVGGLGTLRRPSGRTGGAFTVGGSMRRRFSQLVSVGLVAGAAFAVLAARRTIRRSPTGSTRRSTSTWKVSDNATTPDFLLWAPTLLMTAVACADETAPRTRLHRRRLHRPRLHRLARSTDLGADVRANLSHNRCAARHAPALGVGDGPP